MNKIHCKALSLPRAGGSHYFQFANQDMADLEKFLAKNEFKEFSVTLNTDVMSRSDAQNRFLHGCLIPATMRILKNLGHPRWSDREFVKEVILKKPFLTVGKGSDGEYIRPTSSLKVKEFWEFCNFCFELIVTLGGDLNKSEQQEYLKIIKDYNLGEKIDEALK